MNGCQILNLYNALNLTKPLILMKYPVPVTHAYGNVSAKQIIDRIEKIQSELYDNQKYYSWPPKHVITQTVSIEEWRRSNGN